VDHLGVADELERHEPQRALDVVVPHGVLVTLDRRDHERVHALDTLEPGSDLVRPSEIERHPARPFAQLPGDSRRPLRIPPGDDDRLSPVGKARRDDLSDPRRSTDDDGLAGLAHECAETDSKFRSIKHTCSGRGNSRTRDAR
jgi:hypothetical protein